MTDTVAIDIVAQPTPVIEVMIGVGQQGPAGPAWQPGFTSVNASGVLPAGTNGLVLVDSTGGTLTVTLPPEPSLGQSLTMKDVNGTAGANHITVAGGGFTIEGTLTLVIGSNYGWVQVAFTGTAWVQV
jgi:hypothetical protein